MKQLIFIVSFIFLQFALKAQDWRSQYLQAQELANNEEYEQAIERAQVCIDNYIKNDGRLSDNYASILRLLSTTCYAAGQYSRGVNYTLKELEVRDNLNAPKDLLYASTLDNLGSFYLIMEEYTKAENPLSQALEIYQQYLGNQEDDLINVRWKLAIDLYKLNRLDQSALLFKASFEGFGNREEVSPDYLSACFYYGLLQVDQSQYQKAIPFFKNASTLYEVAGLGDTEENATIVGQLAFCYQQLPDLATADRYFIKAQAIYKNLAGEESDGYKTLVGKRALNLQQMGKNQEAEELMLAGGASIVALNKLAVLNQNAANYAKAEELYLRALSMASDINNLEFAEIQENLATLYMSTGRLTKADTLLASSNGIIKKLLGEEHERFALSLQKMGMLKKNSGDGIGAKQLYDRAQKIFENTIGTQNLAYANLLNSLASWHQERGEYTKAEILLAESLNIYATLNQSQHLDMASVYNNLAIIKNHQADYISARNYLEASLAIIRKTAGTNSLAFSGSLENLALINLELGEYTVCGQQLDQSSLIKKNLLGENNPLYANSLLNQSRLKQALGNYNEAEPLIRHALEIIRSSLGQNHPEYASATNALGLLYQTMGNFYEAEPLFIAAATIYEKTFGKVHIEYATTLENLATLYQVLGLPEKAEPLLKEALAIDKQILGVLHPNYAISLHNLASLYQKQDRYSEALPLFEEALAIYEQVYGPMHTSYAGTLYNLAVLYQDQEKYDESEQAFIKTLEIRKAKLGEQHPDYAYSQYGLAVLYHRRGKLDLAKELYLPAINSYLHEIREFFPSLSEKEKSAFYAKIKPIFEAFQDFAVEYYFSGDTSHISAELYNLQLTTKALLLNASNKVRDRILSSKDDNLINLYGQWIGLKEQLVKYYGYSKEDILKEEIDIVALAAQANDLEKQLSTGSSLFASEFDKQSYTWLDVRSTLSENEAAIEIVRIKKKFILDSVMYVALVVKKNTENHPELIVLPRGQQLEGRLFKYYRNSVRFKEHDVISYGSFWDPIQLSVHGLARLYVSTDGIYNKLNLNTLWDPADSKYLVEEFDIRLLSNTREIIEKKPAENVDKIAEVFGFPDFNLNYQATAQINPKQRLTRATAFGEFSKGISQLPGTQIEIHALDSLLQDNGWQSKVYSDVEANETSLKQLQSPNLLHIATHGFFLADLDLSEDGEGYGIDKKNEESNPLFRSGLLLAGSGKSIFAGREKDEEDGILTAYEAMNLSLDKTELIVMSACETGLGEVRNGEGVYGLQRALLVAGAKSVIMSLWKVDDETTQMLMTEFYSRWLSGTNKFDAFNTAQRVLQEKYPDPYHWGAFVILGQ